MKHSTVLFLDQISLTSASFVGRKAATLGFLRSQGVLVPDGFVIPSTVFQGFVEENHLAEIIADVQALARRDPGEIEASPSIDVLADSFNRKPLPQSLIRDLRTAFAWLIDDTGAVVVRSSALDEDTTGVSSAGQQLTVLNVRRFDDLLVALRNCWGSLFRLPAVLYRARFDLSDELPSIAVIVQAQIVGQVAGTMFTLDPVTEAKRIVIEGTWGLGEAIAQGEVTPDRYVVNRETLALVGSPRIGNKRCQRVPDRGVGTRVAAVPPWRRRSPVLDGAQLSGLALLGLQVERLLGEPQDIEWGLAGGRWFIFQSRPITTRCGVAEDEDAVDVQRWDWTSGFLDERLVEPVSPLGWSVLRIGLEDLAFREPLRILGVNPSDLEPITRRWHGLPYVNVAVFEALYKVFPDWLLPEDARRFFPEGDVSRRKRAPRPRSLLSPEVWIGLFTAILADPSVVSPLHNDRAWEAFERHYVKAIGMLSGRVEALANAPDLTLANILELVDEVESENRRLLMIHRWSLTHAEISYSLLRRLARWLLGREHASVLCAQVVEHLGDYSVHFNRALDELARQSSEMDQPGFQEALHGFLEQYGHRSFSLDIMRPNFAADPTQVISLVQTLAQGSDERESAPAVSDSKAVVVDTQRARPFILRPLVILSRRYARLRENQRFTWQHGLALLRRLFLLAGEVLVRQGVVERPDEVFFLTVDDIRQAATHGAVREGLTDLRKRAISRAQQFAADQQRFEQDARQSYPHFLRGDSPLDGADALSARPGLVSLVELRGEPVSPGLARGKARIVVHADDLEQVQAGDILVTRGADPGWTPIFSRISGLVMETGGQLSHASVVAREYRLPAVVGIAGVTSVIQSGTDVIVDGTRGTVQLEGQQQSMDGQSGGVGSGA